MPEGALVRFENVDGIGVITIEKCGKIWHDHFLSGLRNDRV